MSIDPFDLNNIRERVNSIGYLDTADWTDTRQDDGTIRIHVDRGAGDLTVATLPDWGGHVSTWLVSAHTDMQALLDEVDRLRAALDSITANESVVISKADLADGLTAALRATATPTP